MIATTTSTTTTTIITAYIASIIFFFLVLKQNCNSSSSSSSGKRKGNSSSLIGTNIKFCLTLNKVFYRRNSILLLVVAVATRVHLRRMAIAITGPHSC